MNQQLETAAMIALKRERDRLMYELDEDVAACNRQKQIVERAAVKLAIEKEELQRYEDSLSRRSRAISECEKGYFQLTGRQMVPFNG
jgi:hypothetical protein